MLQSSSGLKLLKCLVCNYNTPYVDKQLCQGGYLTDLKEQGLGVKVVFLGVLHFQAHSLGSHLPAEQQATVRHMHLTTT